MRITITLIAIVVGLTFALSFFLTSGPQHTPSAPTTPPETTTDPPPDHPPVERSADKTAESTDAPTPPPTTPANEDETNQAVDRSPIEGLKPRTSDQAHVSKIGSLDAKQGPTIEAEITGWGGGIRYIRLSEYSTASDDATPFAVQQPVEVTDHHGQPARLYPFAARAITINGTRLPLEGVRWPLIEPGVYRLPFFDSQDRPILTVTRRYRISPGQNHYDLRCEQTVINETENRMLRIVWEQYAQGDIPNDDAVYLGDRRMLVAGYQNLEFNPSGQFIYTDDTFLLRQTVLDGTPLWHGNEQLPETRRLVWIASLNRYFGTAVYRPVNPKDGRAQPLDALFPQMGVQILGQTKDQQTMAFTLTSQPLDLLPGQATRLDLAMYAGPRDPEVFEKEPYKTLAFAKLVVYELGCAVCTFQPLAKGLLSFLKGFYWAFRDWGVAIIFLVLCVRLLLHPITKRAQINMFKMSKQMQAMQPEIEKLKKKYKNDQQKFQQEQLKLWREKGMNPVNMLGCLPMFLQTPIWIALYAMLYLAIELRHQPAFYGVFQWISSGQWQFLGDLSSPDQFIGLPGEGFTLNLYFIQPTFAAINILPILMAVVFYIQQRLTTPPPANEQAAQQQKIMKFMVLLFPVMLYSAPSGLTLYILASTFAGIIDSYIVRKHVKEQEEAGTLFEKKTPKPGGFVDRMHKAVETKQQQLLTQQKRQTGRAPKRRKR